MTTLQASAKAVAAANSTLSTFFTGGIVAYEDLKEAGLTPKGYPSAFDTNGILKPTLVFKERTLNPTFAIKDESAQTTSTVQALEVWYYDAPSGSYNNLETMRSTLKGLLHDRGCGGRRMIRREVHVMERDRSIGNALVCYDVYDAYKVM